MLQIDYPFGPAWSCLTEKLGFTRPHTFAKKGRDWLATLELPADERAMLESCLREADFLTREIAHLDREIAVYALGCADSRRLTTIPGGNKAADAVLAPTGGRPTASL
jgi:transposase